MLVASLVLVGGVACVTLIASAIAALCRLVTKSNALSLALGTLALPALICASFLYWVMTMEVDDAPPGMVLIGNLIVIAVIVPIALLACNLTIRFLSRRALRKGR